MLLREFNFLCVYEIIIFHIFLFVESFGKYNAYLQNRRKYLELNIFVFKNVVKILLRRTFWYRSSNNLLFDDVVHSSLEYIYQCGLLVIHYIFQSWQIC